jgi:hypothetical protein
MIYKFGAYIDSIQYKPLYLPVVFSPASVTTSAGLP